MKQNIFPTSFWHIKDTPQSLVDELYEGAYEFKKNHISEKVSNQGGYHSPAFSLSDFHPEGIEYIKEITSEIGECEIMWWYNINGKGHWNIPHAHPGSDFALIIYLTDSDGLLTLINPFPQRLNSQNISVDAKKGDVVIFPSDLVHYVMPNPREEDRISISMNLRLL